MPEHRSSEIPPLPRQQAARMERLYGRWSKTRTRGGDSSAVELESMAWLIGLVSMLVLMPLDAALLGFEIEAATSYFRWLDGPAVASLVALCSLLQAWIVAAGLRALTPEPWAVRASIRWLRRLLAALPAVGLYVLPVWRELLLRKPSWIYSDERVAPSYRPPGRLSRRTMCLRAVKPWWLPTVWGQLGLSFLFFLVAFVWAQWSWHSAATPFDRRIVGGSIAFHALGFFNMAWALRRRARRSPASRGEPAPLLIALFWLVPLPLFAIAGLMLLVVSGDGKSALTSAALASSGRSPRWLAFTDSVRRLRDQKPFWQRLRFGQGQISASISTPKAAARLHLLARLKSVHLLADGASLALGLWWLAADRPRLELTVAVAFFMVLIVTAVTGLGAAITVFFRFVRHLGRRASPEPPHASHVALAALSFAAGLVLGAGLYKREPLAVANILLLYGFTGAVLVGLRPLFEIFLPMNEDDSRQGKQRVGWVFANAGIALAGLSLLSSLGGPQESLLEPIRGLVFLATAGSLLPGLVLCEWLLRPRRAQDFLARQTPVSARLEIAFLVSTAVLPLGGLAVPAWFYLRRKRS